MLTRFELIIILRIQVTNRDLYRRTLAVEAVMEELAGELGTDVETWRLAGLGSGLDLQLCLHNDSRRGEMARELLLTDGAPPEIADAVLACFAEDTAGLTGLAGALAAADALAGAALELLAEDPGSTLDDLPGLLVERRLSPRGVIGLASIGVPLRRGAELALDGLRRIRQDLRL